MDNLVSVLKNPAGLNYDVKAKLLRLIQTWAQIAEAKPSQMGYITQVYRDLKAQSFDFPETDSGAVASAAFVETLTAPEWVDGDVCMRCRTAFTTFNRKHHCRNCGNVFCQQCSTHNMPLSWYGIGQDVRVCDGCFARKAPPKVTAASKLARSNTSVTPAVVPSARGGAAASSSSHHRSATLGSKPKRSQREEDDLALAIKLSLQESGPSSNASRSFSAAPSEPNAAPRATRQPNGRMMEGTDADDDPDLAAAIAASLRDYAPPQPSAPLGLGDDAPDAPAPASIHASQQQQGQEQPGAASKLPLPPSLELPPQEVDSILTFAQTIRAQEEQNRQYGVANAPPSQQAQQLYEKATTARPRMARSLDEAGRRHGVLRSMHDKLTEAVRLYDRLLDAQMSRPAAYMQPPYQQAPPHPQSDYASVHQGSTSRMYQPPAENHYAAPTPQQMYTSAPSYGAHPQQQQYQGQTHPEVPDEPQRRDSAPSNGMYPSLPSAPVGYSLPPGAHPASALPHHLHDAGNSQPASPLYPGAPAYPTHAPGQQPDAAPQASYQDASQTPQQQPSYTYGHGHDNLQASPMPPNAIGYEHHMAQQASSQWQHYAHAATHAPQGEYNGDQHQHQQPHHQHQQAGADPVYQPAHPEHTAYNYAPPGQQGIHGATGPPAASATSPTSADAQPSMTRSTSDLNQFEKLMSPNPSNGDSMGVAAGVGVGPGSPQSFSVQPRAPQTGSPVEISAGIGAHGGAGASSFRALGSGSGGSGSDNSLKSSTLHQAWPPQGQGQAQQGAGQASAPGGPAPAPPNGNANGQDVPPSAPTNGTAPNTTAGNIEAQMGALSLLGPAPSQLPAGAAAGSVSGSDPSSTKVGASGEQGGYAPAGNNTAWQAPGQAQAQAQRPEAPALIDL